MVKMSYNDETMKVDSTDRGLNEKVKVHITDKHEKIYWYLKFSLPLDPSSVTKKTMNVIDKDGYLFHTNISYNQKLELISIRPLANYIEEQYYILCIKKEVRSQNLQNLKADVNILFKIKDGELYDVEELGANVIIPKMKKGKRLPKPSVMQAIKEPKNKVYAFQLKNSTEENKFGDLEDDELATVPIKFNPIIAVAGMLGLVGASVANVMTATVGATGIALLGLIHIAIQIANKEFRSNICYNLAVMNFNKKKYKKADKLLKKALKINRLNEYAEYADNKNSYFLLES